ncbi:hypothetical protein RINTHM_4280 [Richelia intracellularis HM01]|nr:FAD-binding oxidoreductase [Richelia intracellularis]CCH64897.1 hypothetical protein RINTHM_4280 [Richelia intracellularis HM01]
MSVITADNQVQENIDIWGYTSNPLNLMQDTKRQFDSKNIFSPGHFVGEI